MSSLRGVKEIVVCVHIIFLLSMIGGRASNIKESRTAFQPPALGFCSPSWPWTALWVHSPRRPSPWVSVIPVEGGRASARLRCATCRLGNCPAGFGHESPYWRVTRFVAAQSRGRSNRNFFISSHSPPTLSLHKTRLEFGDCEVFVLSIHWCGGLMILKGAIRFCVNTTVCRANGTLLQPWGFRLFPCSLI